MLIKGTSASCKLVNIKVSKAKAYIKLIISSTIPAVTQKYFRFYIQEDSQLSLLSNNHYWIDRNSNYNNDSNNINIDMYRELLIEVDISAGNKGKMLGSRWVRACQLVLVEEGFNKEPVWYSEKLELVSDEIHLPEIKELNIYNTDNFNKLHVELLYKYSSQQDFNYNNENLYTKIVLKSHTTGKILDEATIYEEDTHLSRIYHVFEGNYDAFVDVSIQLYNNAGQIVKQFNTLYKAYLRRFKTYVKHNGRARKIESIFVGRPDNIALQGFETQLSPIQPPSLVKIHSMLYKVIRNDLPLNMPIHFVDISVNDFYVTTIKDQSFSLSEFEYLIDRTDEPEGTVPIKITLKAFRLLGNSKRYSDITVTVFDYNHNVHQTNYCSDTNVVRF